AFAGGEFDIARDNYERAQAIAGQERIELDESMELALARTHAAMGNLDRAQDHLRAALEGARVAGKRLLTARVEVHLGDLAAVRGDSERANEAYRRAESIAEEVGHTELHMRASIRRAYVRFTESNLAEALDQLGETMKRAKKVGDRSGELEVRAHVIHLQLLDRAFETRGGAFSSLLDKATREDLRRARLLCQIFRADVHVASEQFDAARRLLEAAREGAARAEHYTLLLPIAQRARRLPSQAGKTEQKATGAALGSLLPPEEHTLYG
ncbi:MAG: tetratricopeptide repeat protein, partial [Persicimonas sp.]